MNLLQLLPSNVMKFSLQDYQKKLKHFVNKRQIKHTSTVVKPSISFHTMVQFVDAEHFTNEIFRTVDLPLVM